MSATTGKLHISVLSRRRQAMVRRWLERAAEEMYEAEGVDKGMTAEETRLARLTIDAITDQFAESVEPAQVGPLPECPEKTRPAVLIWDCSRPNGTCVRCLPMKYKVIK